LSTEPTPNTSTEELGQQVGHRFRVGEQIARGGMASVYRATQEGVGRTVALKILRVPDDADGTEEFDARFRNEARALASLNHPHIVTLYDFGELLDGRCFLAMEFIDGPRLTDLIKDAPLEPERAIRLMVQVCKALRYAHHHGVIHRDLKPSNLMVRRLDDGSEHVKVVDFGLVKLMDADQEVTRAGLVLGSPHCMAPEQITGQGVGPETDVYAVGILLYRSVLGRYPFHGNTGTATMIAHLNNPVPQPGAADPPLSPELADVIWRCLEKDPTARYRSMDELLRALSAILDLPVDPFVTTTTTRTQATLRLQAPPQPEPPAGWSRAERAMLAGALLFGLLGGASAVAWWSATGANPVQADATASAAEPTSAEAAGPVSPGAIEPSPAPRPAAEPPKPAIEPPKPAAEALQPAGKAAPKPPASRKEAPVSPKEAPSPKPAPAAPPPEGKASTPDGYKGLPSDW
jgi:serine/threonine protein kinase